MFSATALPKFVRLYNGTTAPTIAPTVILSELQVLSLDMNISMDASQIAANLGLSADRHPFTGAQLANFTNSTPPVSATLSNSTSGYASNILDGKWQFVAPAGANTDYALFAFQVPANSKFLVEGIRIATRNTGAIVATTPTTLEWGLSVNGSGTNLATANLPRITIDHQSFPVGATIEAVAPTIDMTLNVPQVCESGKIIHLILTVPVGTATVGQVIRGLYTLKGRFI